MAPIIKNDPTTFNPVRFTYQVLTLDQAKYFIEACEAWRDSANDPEQFGDASSVTASYPGTTQDSACRWALYGLPARQELAEEQQFARIVEYVSKLRDVGGFHRQQLIDRYEDFKRWYEEDRQALINQNK